MRQDIRPVGYVLRKFPVLSETFILNELLALEERGVPLHVFSLMRPNDPRFHENLPRLKARVSYVPGPADLAKLLRHHRRLARWDRRRHWRAVGRVVVRGRPKLVWRLLQAGFVANEARRLRIGHLHAQFANRPTTIAMLASELIGIPFSFTAHAVDIFKHGVRADVLAAKIDAAQFTVAISEFNKDHLRRLAPRSSEKVVRIYNGIDLEQFAPNGAPPRDPFRIICVARLVEKKGLPVLIEACGLLRDRGLAFDCAIVGKGGLRPHLEAMIKRLKLRQQVRLVGPQTQGEVRARYRESHLYVLPCLIGSDGNRDGLPVSLVEALACGLPVVTTPVTGIPEVVRDGRNGVLVPSGDARALADAIASLASDPARFDALRRQARASVTEEFDYRSTTTTLRTLLTGTSV